MASDSLSAELREIVPARPNPPEPSPVDPRPFSASLGSTYYSQVDMQGSRCKSSTLERERSRIHRVGVLKKTDTELAGMHEPVDPREHVIRFQPLGGLRPAGGERWESACVAPSDSGW